MRNARPARAPRPARPAPGPSLVPPLHWTERRAYKASLRELERMCRIEAEREAQLIHEAEREAARRRALREENLK